MCTEMGGENYLKFLQSLCKFTATPSLALKTMLMILAKVQEVIQFLLRKMVHVEERLLWIPIYMMMSLAFNLNSLHSAARYKQCRLSNETIAQFEHPCVHDLGCANLPYSCSSEAIILSTDEIPITPLYVKSWRSTNFCCIMAGVSVVLQSPVGSCGCYSGSRNRGIWDLGLIKTMHFIYLRYLVWAFLAQLSRQFRLWPNWFVTSL